MMKSNQKVYLWYENKIPGYNADIPQEPPHIISFYPAGGKCRGAVLVCPGGGYVCNYQPEGEPIAVWLNSIGFAAFVLGYRVAPYSYPVPLLDVQRALRLIRFNALQGGYAEKPVGVLGSSAGGHLAAMTGVSFNEKTNYNPLDKIDEMSDKPDFMILCYPLLTFRNNSNIDSLKNLTGQAPDKKALTMFSLENLITEKTPPAFIWHTADDQVINVQNSMQFAHELSNKKVSFALHIFQSGRHGLGVTSEEKDVSRWTLLCEDWLDSLTLKWIKRD